MLHWLSQMTGALRACKNIYLISDEKLCRAMSSVTDAAYELHLRGASESPQLLASMRSLVSALQGHMTSFPRCLLTSEACVRRLQVPPPTPNEVPPWAVLDAAIIDEKLGVGARAEGWKVRVRLQNFGPRDFNLLFTAPGGTRRFQGVNDALAHRRALGNGGQPSAATR